VGLTYKDISETIEMLVLDKSKVTVPNREIPLAIKNAVTIFSAYRHRTLVEEYTADGGRIYDLPELWEAGRSESGFQIEYPVDDDADDVQYLDQTMYSLYNTPDGIRIRFRRTESHDFTPPTGEKFRVHYQLSHLVEEGAGGVTIATSDLTAFTALGAAQFCQMMASRFAQMATSAGNNIDYQNRSNVFLSLRKEFMADFNRLVVPSVGDAPAAAKFGSFQTR
jgi:hypothetical protein